VLRRLGFCLSGILRVTWLDSTASTGAALLAGAAFLADLAGVAFLIDLAVVDITNNLLINGPELAAGKQLLGQWVYSATMVVPLQLISTPFL
jgi:hypothetical protein